MIRDLPLESDLENPALELKSQAELSKIVKHNDSRALSDELEAIKVLMSKINNPAGFNWQPIFDEVVLDCDVPLPVGNVSDFRFVVQACFDEARRAKTIALMFDWVCHGPSKTKTGEAKVPYKDKGQNNTNKYSKKASHASASAGDKWTFCGKNYHVKADCRKKSSEFDNHTDYDLRPLYRVTMNIVVWKDERRKEELIYVCNRLWLSSDLKHVDNLVVSDQLVFPNK